MVEQVALANLENSVADPVLREKLRPNYRAACKRLILSPDYYEKVQQPGVEVVREDIAAVEPEGVRTRDGRLHPLDVLVLATGFKTDQFMRPMTVTGRGGVSLDTLWARRPSAYLALSIPDFPNLFLVNGPSAPFGNYSSIGVAEQQVDYILKLLDLARSEGAREVSVKAEAMAAYDAQVREAAKGTIFASGCSSWYLDADGVPSIWPWTYDHFTERMAAPDVESFELVA
jgi:cation diffusion facilitator CzcD-associated flavoprotein CzcO